MEHSGGNRHGRLCTAVAIFGLLRSAITAAAQQPTQQEQNLFNAVRTRMEGHAAQMPRVVSDVSTSLSNDCWGMSFFCPHESGLLGVTFMCTRLD